MKTIEQVLSAEKYEASRPAGEQKLVISGHESDFVIRAYVDDKGGLHVLMHRVSEDNCEQLPLGYILGVNAATLNPRR
jgi:hypothetical protein